MLAFEEGEIPDNNLRRSRNNHKFGLVEEVCFEFLKTRSTSSLILRISFALLNMIIKIMNE